MRPGRSREGRRFVVGARGSGEQPRGGGRPAPDPARFLTPRPFLIPLGSPLRKYSGCA